MSLVSFISCEMMISLNGAELKIKKGVSQPPRGASNSQGRPVKIACMPLRFFTHTLSPS
jgi:hypothetical protein